MEGGLPMLNCLLQQTLRSLCSSSNSDSSADSCKWVYAVFWRILPRNYPPPKWDHGGGAFDRTKGNKRNWILVWEDGFCDFYDCERTGSGYIKGRFGADIFFKMSHEVYNYGEGLVGKAAADNSHKWVFRDSSTNENDPTSISSWNVSIDPQPRAWEIQFNSGIQTIAIISVREGIIQLGSFDKIVEDLNLVISIQRKFSYLQSIPGIFAIQRPFLPIQHTYTFKPSNPHLIIQSTENAFAMDDSRGSAGLKRLPRERLDVDVANKSVNLGYNSPQNCIAGGPTAMWAVPPLFPPSMSNSLGALLSKLPSVAPTYNAVGALDTAMINNQKKNTSQSVKLNQIPGKNVGPELQNSVSINPNLGLQDGVGPVELGFGPTTTTATTREVESSLNLN